MVCSGTELEFLFWLTGEIPQTLQLVIEGVQRRYIVQGRGRKCSLSLHNQVSELL